MLSGRAAAEPDHPSAGAGGHRRAGRGARSQERGGGRLALALLYLAAAAGWLREAGAACPNGCSGHGDCGPGSSCSCFAGWDVAADCSERSCAYGPAWADKAYSSNAAHTDVECSNAGLCDRITGLCTCFEGFTGQACQRTRCPNDCSGNGICQTIRDIGLYEGADYDTATGTGGDGLGPAYANWDSDSVTMCNCDAGFFGPDCSKLMCPKGDDPFTIGQSVREIQVSVASASAMGGTLRFSFMGYTFPLSIDSPASRTGDAIAEAWESSDAIDDVAVTVASQTAQSLVYNVRFLRWSAVPVDNNIHAHDGNPALTMFTCDISDATGSPTCTITDVQATNVIEDAPCGNRGLCDVRTGSCACFAGYTGLNCTHTAHQTTYADAASGQVITAGSGSYTGDVLQLVTGKAAASDFSFLNCVADSETVFSVRGDGKISTAELEVLSGGGTVKAGGLTVLGGGGTIEADGMTIAQGHTSKSALSVRASSTAYEGSVLELLADRSDDLTLHHLITAGANSSTSKFSVRADGYTAVEGGLSVRTGATVATGGLLVARDGATVQSGGLTVSAGGFEVAGGGATVTAAATQTTLHVENTATAFDSQTSIMRIQSALADEAVGSYNGVLLEAKNADGAILRVTNEPLTRVDRGGMRVTGGQTIESGGLTVVGGATFSDSGIRVAGGCTVTAEDLVIDAVRLTSTSSNTGNAGDVSVVGGRAQTGGGLLGGNVHIVSGASDDSTSGHVSLRTADAGGAGVSGSVDVLTGHASLGDSGRVTLRSGAAASGAGGRILISVGDGDAGGSGGGGGGGGGLSLFSGSTTASGAAGGAVTVTSGAGATSGAVAISSGGSGAASGSVALTSGDGTTAGSGTLTARTGAATTGTSGSAAFGSGATAGSGGGDTGAVSVTSGSSGGGASGALTIGTGIGGGDGSGAVTVSSGTSFGGGGGHVLVSVGEGSVGAGGQLSLLGGRSAGTAGGKVRIEGGASSAAAGGDIELVPGNGATKGVLKLMEAGGTTVATVSGTTGLTFTADTGSASGNAATLNAQSGEVTSSTASLAAGASEEILVTNSYATAASLVVASVSSACTGGVVVVTQATTGEANRVKLRVQNLGAQACTSTYKVTFMLVA